MLRIPRNPPPTSNTTPIWRYVLVSLAACAVLILFMFHTSPSSSTMRGSHGMPLEVVDGRKIINLISWNMAAINNNPFEYWITYSEDPSYDKLMQDVSIFIENPEEKDIPVSEVFTDEMFDELLEALKDSDIDGIEETKLRWTDEYKERKIISEFIKDGLIGKKRLTSMPDRISNTINTADGPVYRPTVINCYSEKFASKDEWWSKWKEFMFETELSFDKSGEKSTSKVISMLQPIKHSKYPSISEEEEKISIPLQTLAMAIFDAILVHMMTELSPSWQKLRKEICTNLNLNKNERSLEILLDSYGSEDIYFLQEVSFSFIDKCKASAMAESYHVIAPGVSDSERDQNSVILLRKSRYGSINEVTHDILAEFPPGSKVPVADGDLIALQVTDITDNSQYLLCSFHGDTNGLATVPIVDAVQKYATTKQRESKLIFGMDANTYEKPEADQQGVVAFAEFFTGLRLSSCYGNHPNPQNYTTFAARTHLQPQLNKAVAYDEKDTKGDKNPKDFVLFFAADYEVASAQRDNTGSRSFVDNMVIPTLQFPSDHAITFASFIEN